MSSGQGEIPDRRYSPRAIFGMNRCNSDTDSRVWMEEDGFYLRSCCVDGKHLEGIALSGVIYF